MQWGGVACYAVGLWIAAFGRFHRQKGRWVVPIEFKHQHYGSALFQIAQDPHFTTINAVHYRGRKSRCGFRINKVIGVYLKYVSEPQGKKTPVYPFSFSQENLKELRVMQKNRPRLFLALVCVKDREICCLPYNSFRRLIEARKKSNGKAEEEYIVEVFIWQRNRLRVWINFPGRRHTFADELKIPRNDFPRKLFET